MLNIYKIQTQKCTIYTLRVFALRIIVTALMFHTSTHLHDESVAGQMTCVRIASPVTQQGNWNGNQETKK